jgi:hypothetical protein
MLAQARRAARESVRGFYFLPGVGPGTGQPQANIRSPVGAVSMPRLARRGDDFLGGFPPLKRVGYYRPPLRAWGFREVDPAIKGVLSKGKE